MTRAAVTLIAILALLPGAGHASSPPNQHASMQRRAGQHILVTWTGVIPPGGAVTNECESLPGQLTDVHTIDLGVPAGMYSSFVAKATFTLSWDGPTDGVLTVESPTGSAVSSDNGSVDDDEHVVALNPKGGEYRVIACAFAGVAQAYTGTLDLTTSLAGTCPSDVVAGIDLQSATIPQLQRALGAGTLTSRRLVQAYLDRIDVYDRKLDAIRELNKHALKEADALDAERKAKGSRGPLHGIPVLLKDNVGTKDMPTTAGSIALEGSIPFHDAFVTQQLRKAGAIILGKVNLSEFANWVDPSMPSGYSSLGGQVVAPYDFGNPSGSSSGSAVAAAMAFATVTIGSETSGSILSPSVTNSDVGIKPTTGLVSRAGIIPLAGTFDTAGPITRTVTDAAIVLGAITGIDSRDPKTSESQGKFKTDYRPYLRVDAFKGKRIGVSDSERNGLGEAEQKLFDSAVATMQGLGATIVHTDDLTNTRDVGLVELGAIPNEFKYYLNKYLAEETPDSLRVRTLDDIMNYNAAHPDKVKYGQRYITVSNATLGNVDEPSALAVRTAAIQGSRAAIDAVMSQNDLDAVLAPGAANANVGAAALYPSIAFQAGYSDGGTPFGLTLLGQPYTEPALIGFAFAYESAAHVRVRPTVVNRGLCPIAAPKPTRVLGTIRRRGTGSGALPATGTDDVTLGMWLIAAACVVSRRRSWSL